MSFFFQQQKKTSAFLLFRSLEAGECSSSDETRETGSLSHPL